MKPAALFSRPAPRWLSRVVLALALVLIAFCVVRYVLPVYRVPYRSQLIMLGDFNADHQWSQADREHLRQLLENPYRRPALECARADVNANGRLDEEDLAILERLFDAGDPYTAETNAIAQGRPFPRPRELCRYVSSQDYLNRPLFALPYPAAATSPLACLARPRSSASGSPYAKQLQAEITDEAIRCDLAYRMRQAGLTPMETEYGRKKLALCNQLWTEGRDFELLLELIGLSEDVETLTTAGADPTVIKCLLFRDHLRELLTSKIYDDFRAGRIPPQKVFKTIEGLLKQDLGLTLNLENLGAPRDLTSLENYLDRTQWQYYKSRTQTAHFEQLIRFAQHDRRYLRAVARTSRKHADAPVMNHNLPMILLFREALRITGDKKAAVGLLDESIRIPLFWVKSIPRDKLPGSLALENFLLPGNKEDGADKSRHWNVFGGICLYRSPSESLELALKREMQDWRDDRQAAEGMTEFIRDMIANLNGIYYVVSMNPNLLREAKP